MTEAEAQQKICPTMSGMLSQSMNTPGTPDIMMNWEINCVGPRCMAWEATVGAEMLEGYCKLMETNNEF